MFGYLRLFSLISVLTIIIIAVVAGMSFRDLAMTNVVRLIEKNHAGLAQGYINSVWRKYREVIVPLSQGDPSKLKGEPKVQQFAQDTVYYFQQMPLIRVNLYNANSALLLTVNVSNTTKLATTAASPDSTFVANQIQRGGITSNLLQNVGLQNGSHATILQILVPIRVENSAGDESEAVMEMVYDITQTWQELMHFQMFSTGGIIVIFLVFLCILYLTSRRAEIIIARQHEANIELSEAATAAQAENREKSQFLANVSHELRTPLNAIIGFSEIIKTEVMEQIPDRKYQDYINDIHSSGVHLLSLINDILDYSKAEAGKLELEVSEVNVTKIIQNCMRLVYPRAEVGQVKLVEALPKDAFIMVTDGKKFKQILLNLLSNAVKFTPAGGEVTVTAWPEVAENGYSFQVQDTGIGIAPKDISRAMAPFGQVDSTLKRKYEGTGLGLPLTKKFVELMGGKFAIESEVNVGTKITFTLPRELNEREGIIVKHAS